MYSNTNNTHLIISYIYTLSSIYTLNSIYYINHNTQCITIYLKYI